MKNKLAQLKNSKLLNILIVVLFVVVFFLYNRYAIKNINNDELKEWNNFIIKNAEIFATNDWFTYDTANIFSTFSISFPNDWKLNGSVLTNKDGQKIAEFSPGLVQLKPNQNCFDSEWNSEGGESELISQNNIEVGPLKGKLLIEKVHAWNGSTNNEYWYPYFYCLSNGSNAFVVTFYERKLGSIDIELHNKILSTLKF